MDNIRSEIDPLIQALYSKDAAVRDAASEGLIKIGSPAVDSLLAVVNANQRPACWPAASALTRIRDERCFEAMKGWLLSDPMYGEMAAGALAAYGTAGEDLLISALPTAHIMVQMRIVVTLERLNIVRAVPQLTALLQTTASSTLRHMSIQALGILGNPSAIPTIRQFIDDEDHHVRKRVSIALNRLGDGVQLQTDIHIVDED